MPIDFRQLLVSMEGTDMLSLYPMTIDFMQLLVSMEGSDVLSLYPMTIDFMQLLVSMEGTDTLSLSLYLNRLHHQRLHHVSDIIIAVL